MKFKNFLMNLGLYILPFISYLLAFAAILSSSLYFLQIYPNLTEIIIGIFLLLSAIYIFVLWKWYQLDLKLEVAKTKLTSSVWLPLLLFALFFTSQFILPFPQSDNQRTVEALNEQQPLFTFVYAVLVGPAIEELLTRGFLAKFLFPKQDKLWEILLYLTLSSSIFSLIHLPSTLPDFLVYFSMGAIFGLLYVTKKDIRYPIALHMLNNLLALIF